MSSKNDEKESRSIGIDVNKKKKHKHKICAVQENEYSSTKVRHKPSISSENEGPKPHKYNKQKDATEIDLFAEVKMKSSNGARKEKKQKCKTSVVEQLKATAAISPVSKKMPTLTLDGNSDNEEIHSITNFRSDGKLTQAQKCSKFKQKIYSSSENEDGISETTKKSLPNKTESSENYFDGWSKEDVVQLISKMVAALPKNDTLKYVSRVEKLNWEQIAFGKYTAAECKKKWKTIEKKIRGYRILQEVLTDAKIWLEHPWTDFYRGGKRKNRHPDMPKKPLTSYMIFYMKKKEKITRENPGIGLTNLSKIIAEKFNKLSPKKKAKYNKLANAMREKYQEDLQKFYLDHPSEGEKINAAKNKKALTIGMPGPAKPISPLKLFLEDKVKQHKDEKEFNQALLIQQCKEKWKTMSSKKKMPWIRWAYETEMKYLEELKSYQAENPSFEMPKIKSVLSKEEKKVLQRMEGKPEKPPGSAYGLFSKLMLKDPDLRVKFSTPKERMQKIAKMWKEVPKLEKDGYSEQLKHLLENYKLEYASYLESLPEDKREEELASNLPKRKVKGGHKSSQKKLKLDEQTTKKNDKMLLEELMAKEPKTPNNTTFDLFQEEMIIKGLNPKKVKKAWEDASLSTKQKYEMKLEALRQKYIVDYKAFLTNLKPEVLSVYCKAKNESRPTETDSQISEESSNESVEEKVDNNVKKDIRNPSSSSASSASSSSKSSSSTASSASSASSDEDAQEADHQAEDEQEEDIAF